MGETYTSSLHNLPDLAQMTHFGAPPNLGLAELKTKTQQK